MAASAPQKATRDTSTKNLTMGDLMARFRCEDACRDYLEVLRWPDGPCCPRCGSDGVAKLKERNQYECHEKECGYHFSVTAGTKLHDSHLPLWKWFLVTFLMIHSKKGVSAKQVQRMVGGSYKTSWYLCHRIRAAMQTLEAEKLDGIVEIDHTFVGGKRKRTKSRSYRDYKSIVVTAVERGGEVRFAVLKNEGKRSFTKFFEATVDDKARAIFTDEHTSYDFDDDDTVHESVKHSKYEWARDSKYHWIHERVHSNTAEGVFSLLKRAIIGSYHKVSTKHLPAYLKEIAFKYNNRDNPYLFRETLMALLFTETLPYSDLVKPESKV